MNIFGWSISRKASATKEAPTKREAGASSRVPVAAIGRHSADDAYSSLFRNSLQTIRPLGGAKVWRDFDLDASNLDALPIDSLVELLIDVSPEISRGVFDFIRMVNPEWTLHAYALTASTDQAKADTTEREEDSEASEYLNNLLKVLRDWNGDPNVVFNKVILGGFLRGGFLAELVLGPDGQTVDLVTPDPATLAWRQFADPIRGVVWKFGQYQQGEFVVLSDFPTIQYVPIDALPGKPYGRSLVHPALFPSLFLIGLLSDLKRVVAQQGYPRLDLEIVLEKLLAAFGDEVAEDPDRLKAIVEQTIQEVKDAYGPLKPDDAYIHTDVVKVNKPVGAVDSSSLGAIDKIIAILERMMVRALKTMPLMLALVDSTSEANANRQWEIYTAAIKSIQKSVQSLFESIFSTALQAAGLQAVVEFRFKVLRASEELRDAQTEKLRIDNARAKYNAGWISQDEASKEVTGHKAVEPKPLMAQLESGQGGVANPLTVQPEPGANRAMLNAYTRNAVTLAALLTLPIGEPPSDEVRNAEAYWKTNSPEPAKELIEAETVE
jgi:hypothetical protein